MKKVSEIFFYPNKIDYIYNIIIKRKTIWITHSTNKSEITKHQKTQY